MISSKSHRDTGGRKYSGHLSRPVLSPSCYTIVTYSGEMDAWGGLVVDLSVVTRNIIKMCPGIDIIGFE